MIDEEVPLDRVVCAGVGVQSRDLNLSIGAVILACVDEQDAVAGKSKTSCERRTTRTRSNDNVLVSRIGYGSFGRIVVTIRRELWVVRELWPCPLETIFCEYKSSELSACSCTHALAPAANTAMVLMTLMIED